MRASGLQGTGGAQRRASDSAWGRQERLLDGEVQALGEEAKGTHLQRSAGRWWGLFWDRGGSIVPVYGAPRPYDKAGEAGRGWVAWVVWAHEELGFLLRTQGSPKALGVSPGRA